MSLVDPITVFNKELAKMFETFQALSSNPFVTNAIKEMRSKIMGSVSANAEYAAHIVGPFILNNAAKIKDGDSKYFLAMKYDVQLMKLSQEHKFNYQNSLNAIEKIKTDFLKAKPERQIEVIKQCQALMQKYFDYYIAKLKTSQ